MVLLKVVVLTLALGGLSLAGEGDGPVCLSNDDAEKFCSESSMPDGQRISEVVQSVLWTPVIRTGFPEVSPQKFDDPIPASEGPFASNAKLDKGNAKILEGIKGPESILVEGDYIYAAAVDGIYKVHLKTGERKLLFDGTKACTEKREHCSRSLGIRINQGRILCADAFLGLLEVHEETGNFKVLLPNGVDIDGEKLTFPDDLDVDWDTKMVYISDGSTKWPLNVAMMAILEGDTSGRIIRYNLESGKADVFAKGIRFANGVQLSHDKQSLLVNEFTGRRVLKFAVNDPTPVIGVPFTVSLPGNPDNIRPTTKGGYWVALVMGRVNSSRTILDEFLARPHLNRRFANWLLSNGEVIKTLGVLAESDSLQTLGQRLQSGFFLLDSCPKVGLIVEVDADGKVLQTLQSVDYSGFTQATEAGGVMYLGSYANPYVVTVPESSYRA